MSRDNIFPFICSKEVETQHISQLSSHHPGGGGAGLLLSADMALLWVDGGWVLLTKDEIRHLSRKSFCCSACFLLTHSPSPLCLKHPLSVELHAVGAVGSKVSQTYLKNPESSAMIQR